MTATSSDTASTPPVEPEAVVYEGHFGSFTIDQHDRREVTIYRSGLMVAALSFAIATALLLLDLTPFTLHITSGLYTLFWLALGVSLATIHIYLVPLHRMLQVFWGIGGLASLWVAHHWNSPFAQTIYEYPLTLLGVGFVFAALTGIYFKEAFCFNRLETKALTPLVPLLLLGHMTGVLTLEAEKVMLGLWAVLFVVFALRKAFQPRPDDIGDKSVFEYMKQKR